MESVIHAVKSVRINTTDRTDSVLKRAAVILSRVIRERTGIRARNGTEAGMCIELGVSPDLPVEGYRIAGGKYSNISIEGGSALGVVYGVGQFLRNSQYKPGRFMPGAWRGSSTPEKPVRGMYFASHFHNFYHNAPRREVERYIEELALWGFNTVAVWFDMHHYRGLDDPSAQAMLKRLRVLLGAVKAIGMHTALAVLANEGYASTPPRLRAQDTGRNHYGVEICPATPEGRRLILKNIRGELEQFRDIGIDYISLGPYDQGGCGCPRCAPWGANGFLSIARDVVLMARTILPDIRTILFTWLFDYAEPKVEWKGLQRAFAKKPDWVDYIMADSHTDFPDFPLRHGVPGGLPMLNFPEISMWECLPWGGFGASPLPGRFQSLWKQVGSHLAGGFPYSEGIFEDINKVVVGRFYWCGRASARNTVREYAAYEFGQEVADAVEEIVKCMEANHPHRIWMRFKDGHEGPCFWNSWRQRTENYRFEMPGANWATVRTVWGKVRRVDARLPGWARKSWRWRLLYLRAAIDVEIMRSGGKATARLGKYFGELCARYHAKKTVYYVAPPTRRNVLRAPTQSEV